MSQNSVRLQHLAKGPTTVAALEKQLRRMLGHLTSRDRQAVLDAIEAIHELASRLHAATRPAIERIDDDAARALGLEAPING